MKHKKEDLQFCEIYFNIFNDSLKESITVIKKAFEYNKKFFNLHRLPKFKIILVDSRKEFDKLWGEKSQKWISGFAKKTTIIIFTLEKFEKETCWKKEEFYSTLVHEINHIFFTSITKKIYDPLWLSEGLATYLQNNQKKPKKTIKISNEILNKNSNYKIPKYDMYNSFIYYLIKKYGKNKIIQLLKIYGKNKNIKKSLKIVYNKDIKELIKNANKI